MGNRSVLLLKIVVLAVLTVAAGAWVVMRATSDLAPRPAVTVLDDPKAPGAETAVKTPADFTVIDPPRPAPAASFEDAVGRQFTLADFRGRVVLLNLWATWCAPCVREMPSLDRLQAKLGGGADFDVIALSQDRQGLAVVKPFFAKQGLNNLPPYLDPKGAMARALGEQSLPASLLIDRAGRIVGRLTGPAAWDAPEWITLLRRAIAAPAPPGS